MSSGSRGNEFCFCFWLRTLQKSRHEPHAIWNREQNTWTLIRHTWGQSRKFIYFLRYHPRCSQNFLVTNKQLGSLVLIHIELLVLNSTQPERDSRGKQTSPYFWLCCLRTTDYWLLIPTNLDTQHTPTVHIATVCGPNLSMSSVYSRVNTTKVFYRHDNENYQRFFYVPTNIFIML